MIERRAGLRVAVPDVEAARLLGRAWLEGAAPVAAVETIALHDAEHALRRGSVDAAFLPTLSVLRAPESFSIVPGVALVGSAYQSARLHLPTGIGQLVPGSAPRIGMDPRLAQEAVLTHILLKEAYGAQAQFVPVSTGGTPPQADAYLLARDAPLPDGGTTLDLGREWFELTTRPMVWALLATVAGGVDSYEAALLGDEAAAHEGPPPDPGVEEPASVTLAEYASAGLDALIHHLFYHRAIEELIAVPFVGMGGDDDDDV